MNLSRRNFVQGALLGGVALGAVGLIKRRPALPPLQQMADVSGLTPPSDALNSQSFALGKFLPSLEDPDDTEGPFIVNTPSRKASSASYFRRGAPGNSVFLTHDDARPTIPWAPIFSR